MNLPRFNPGDHVILSGHKQPVNFHGKVVQVIPYEKFSEELYRLFKTDETVVAVVTKMVERDKSWHEWPCYYVEPNSSPGVATYEEAQYIVPGITYDQYMMLTTRRLYLCLDSDLMDEQQEEQVSS